MSDADKAPLVFHFVQTAQEKLTKTSGLFDLAEDWLGELLTETVATSMTAEFQLFAHRLSERPADLAAGCRSLRPPRGVRPCPMRGTRTGFRCRPPIQDVGAT